MAQAMVARMPWRIGRTASEARSAAQPRAGWQGSLPAAIQQRVLAGGLVRRFPGKPEGPALSADRRVTDEGEVRSHALRVQAGDGEAFGDLFKTLRPDVMRLCTRLVGREEAEDATHEIFLRAQGGIDTFDAAQPFRRWLLAIGSHHCIDRLRRRSTERLLFEPGEADARDPKASPTTALDGIVRAQNRDALLTALDRLPDRFRAPLVLRYFADLDYDAIAAELELTRAQVGTLLFRAKRRLRVLLSAESEALR